MWGRQRGLPGFWGSRLVGCWVFVDLKGLRVRDVKSLSASAGLRHVPFSQPP